MRKFAIAPVRLVLVLWLAGLGAAAQFAKISIILPELREFYPDATLSLGFLVSLLSVIGIFLGLFAGLIATQIGFRKILIYALVLGSIISAFQATMPAISLLLVSRVFEGFSHLGIVVAAPTLIAQISTTRFQPWR
jgi:DHA1 family inner membrane transport protein